MADDRTLFDDPRITLMGLFVEAYGALTSRTASQISEHDLAPAEFEALLRLSRSAERSLRMSDLAAQAALTNSGATRLVDRLESRGLVTRETSPDDRRGTTAVITEDGLRKVTEVLPGHLSIVQDAFLDGVPAEARAPFFEALRAIRDHLRPEAERGAR
ncbi:MarR family winged helix-turn-helix transcriptional regulator [Hoyosella subflava]|uniref:Transcriptional regulator, MarR family n=1 Tax=Hoyosella subflava (strain DSM 45089 / JCM 17490 / NBRC 109087 / DQS3-9A1) TaxID=443218 RepID=F6EEX1_HOYSD|nr:MarR family transcriptional regulator [Hoyosella subflava]AEF42108.1 Transcriptional regulator, MarR family [Hoyosella subflava DQS3-9A1]